MTHKPSRRPHAVEPPDAGSDPPGGPDRTPGFTPAEEHALRRSAPLTPTQFEELRHATEHAGDPLRPM